MRLQQLERLLLQQRDEVTDLRRRLSAAVVAETLTTNDHEIASEAQLARDGQRTLEQRRRHGERLAAVHLQRDHDRLAEEVRALKARGGGARGGGRGGAAEATPPRDLLDARGRRRGADANGSVAFVGALELRAQLQRPGGGGGDGSAPPPSSARPTPSHTPAPPSAAAAAAAEDTRRDGLEEEARGARAEAEAAAAEVARLNSVLNERGVQVAILTETVEAMSGGGDAEARIASLSAQLSAAQAVQARLSRRLHEQQAAAEASLAHRRRLETALAEARGGERSLRAEVASLREADEAQSAAALRSARQQAELQAELRAAEDAAAQLERAAAALAEAHDGARAQISELQSRHATQLQKERDDHNAVSRGLREQLLRARDAADEARAAAGGSSLLTLPGATAAVVGGGGCTLTSPLAAASSGAAEAGGAAAEGPLRSVRQQLLVAVDEARLAIGRAAAASSNTEGDAADGGGGDGAAAVEKEVVGHLRALLVEHNEQLGAALLKADLATQEADLARRELAAAAPALERHALERDVCASRLNIVHRQLAERHASGDQWSE